MHIAATAVEATFILSLNHEIISPHRCVYIGRFTHTTMYTIILCFVQFTNVIVQCNLKLPIWVCRHFLFVQHIVLYLLYSFLLAVLSLGVGVQGDHLSWRAQCCEIAKRSTGSDCIA